MLWQLYKELKGATPSKEKITDLSIELNLSENQIYKWFWDTKKKVDEDNNEALQMQGNKLSVGSSVFQNKVVSG